MTFDTIYPEFKNIIGKTFADISTETKSQIAAEWAVSGDWSRVDLIIEGVDPFLPIGAFNGLDWHTWLLTRKDEACFDRWLRIREVPLNKDRDEWNTAAALLAYANEFSMFERLLHDEDLTGLISPTKMFVKNGLRFESAAANGNNNRVNNFFFSVEKIESGFDNMVGPLELSGYHASIDLFDTFLKRKKEILIRNPSNTKKSKKFHGLSSSFKNTAISMAAKLWMSGDERIDILKMYELLNVYNGWALTNSGTYIKSESSALLFALENMSAESLSELAEIIDAKSVDTVFVNIHEWNNVVKGVLFGSGSLEKKPVVDKLVDKAVASKMPQMTVYVGDLWDAIKNNKQNVVQFILKEHPELLEEKNWIFENRHERSEKKGSKKGTALAFACLVGNMDIANYLIGVGADTSVLKDILAYKPFMNSEKSVFFKTAAEKILLGKKILIKTTPQQTKIFAL